MNQNENQNWLTKQGHVTQTGPKKIQILLPGYLPPSRNRLKGAHWSRLHREKLRAAAALKSAFMCSLANPAIGTDTMLRSCRIWLSTLESYLMTTGKHSGEKSSRTKSTGALTREHVST